jgi:predicted aconitase with swiveling domain
LYTGTPIAFLQGVDPELGIVVDKKHDLFGKNFSRKVLVFPNAVGSSVGAYVIYRLKKNHKAPLAMINQVADIITASGCAISNIPLFDLPSATIQQLSYAKSIRLDADGRIALENK